MIVTAAISRYGQIPKYAGGCCCSGYLARVGFVTGFGVFLALTGHIAYMNWMYFPLDYTLAYIVDAVGGWFLTGLVIAAIVKPMVACSKDDAGTSQKAAAAE